jgi:voltage-gated potassium channel
LLLRHFVLTHIQLLYELSGALIALLALIVICGYLISRFDKVGLEEAIYFAFITAFTVGFGDVTPKSRGSRAICVFLAFLGMILVGVVVAVSVSALDAALDARNALAGVT